MVRNCRVEVLFYLIAGGVVLMRMSESDYKAYRTKEVAKKPKFGNKKVEIDGQVFDSKKEAARFHELKLMERAGVIKDLETQPVFQIEINGVKVCKYVADFQYLETGKLVVEDVKSAHTRTLPVYRLKNKLMRACLGIEIREV
jgi:hypothetical protein